MPREPQPSQAASPLWDVVLDLEGVHACHQGLDLRHPVDLNSRKALIEEAILGLPDNPLEELPLPELLRAQGLVQRLQEALEQPKGDEVPQRDVEGAELPFALLLELAERLVPAVHPRVEHLDLIQKLDAGLPPAPCDVGHNLGTHLLPFEGNVEIRREGVAAFQLNGVDDCDKLEVQQVLQAYQHDVKVHVALLHDVLHAPHAVHERRHLQQRDVRLEGQRGRLAAPRQSELLRGVVP
mmetsp:Transcript_87335/g.260577  ORF Transcript_87335/g.260577 Transcript_87335/m.260577 type:complete len:239 (-) Transcript_87335:650-1366(-)